MHIPSIHYGIGSSNILSRKQEKGFTIIEALVAFALFSLIIGSVLGLIITGIASQRQSIEGQDAFGQAAFLAESMARALRQAQKDTSTACFGISGLNYQTPTSSTIRFLDRDDRCREYLLNGDRIEERISTDHQASNLPPTGDPLTSGDLRVNTLAFHIDGESQELSGNPDSNQPRVTFIMEIESKNAEHAPTLRIQTTVTQRVLDIRR